MCFSPEASFVGGVIISAVGVATVTKVHNPGQVVFASIPLFFGIQQIAEGFLWLALQNIEYGNIQKFSTYFFLVMADVIWPTMIPLSVMFMEQDAKRKRWLKILLVFGILLSSYYAYCLMFFNVNPQINGYHIKYVNDFPKSLKNLVLTVYLIVTIIPLFISSIKRTHILGVLMSFSCLIAAIFFRQYLTSVWCFFAALISGVIFWILRDSMREFKLNKLVSLKNPFR